MDERNWKVLFYIDSALKSELYDYINSLKKNHKSKVISLLTLLSEKGPNLVRPYADLIEEGIHELRIKLSGNQLRILYFFCFKDYIILTNSFIKTTDKVPKIEIMTAKKLKEDFLKRFTESNIGGQINENI